MAQIKKGILGPLSGTIGNVVGSRWKGIDYLRSIPSSYSDPRTEAQLTQRMKFGLTTSFLRSVGPVLRIGFRNTQGNQSARNRAFSVNIRSFLAGSYPDLSIDPMKVQLSEGNLQGTHEATLDLSTPGEVSFSWMNDSGVVGVSDQDSVQLVVYNTAKEEVSYRINGANRSDASVTFPIPQHWSGDPVAGYLFFASVENNEVSPTFAIAPQLAA